MRRVTQDLLLGVGFSALSVLVLGKLADSGPSAPPAPAAVQPSPWPALREHPDKVASYAIDARLDTQGLRRSPAHSQATSGRS